MVFLPESWRISLLWWVLIEKIGGKLGVDDSLDGPRPGPLVVPNRGCPAQPTHGAILPRAALWHGALLTDAKTQRLD